MEELPDVEYKGLRVHDGHDHDGADGLRLFVDMVVGDTAERLGPITDLVDLVSLPNDERYAAVWRHKYFDYLATAIIRGLSLGITPAEVEKLFVNIRAVTHDRLPVPQLPIVGIMCEHEFETLFERDGGYLRVVEDEYAEQLTEDDLRELMDERTQ